MDAVCYAARCNSALRRRQVPMSAPQAGLIVPPHACFVEAGCVAARNRRGRAVRSLSWPRDWPIIEQIKITRLTIPRAMNRNQRLQPPEQTIVNIWTRDVSQNCGMRHRTTISGVGTQPAEHIQNIRHGSRLPRLDHPT